MEVLIGGTWQPAASGRTEDVTSPFDGAVVGTVPVADADDVRIALDRAAAGAAAWRRTPAHGRMRILLRAVDDGAKLLTGGERDDAVLAQANGTPYGLGVGIFTSGGSGAVREIDAGNVHINWTPLWRADLIPCGGLEASGIGREGPRSAVAEMTDVKTVILPGRPW